MSELPSFPMVRHEPSHLRADDLVVCLQILAEGSKSFAAASRVLPARVRAPASALYAFCRVADDLVDTSGIADAVPELERRLDAIYAGAPATDAVDRAFAAVVLRSELPRAVPDALIEGFAWDVEGRTYEEISTELNIPVNTVGALLTRARAKLREMRPSQSATEIPKLTKMARDEAKKK
jgi:phytoene synthase